MRLFASVVLSLLALLLLTIVAIDLMPTRWMADRIEAMASERLGTPIRLDKLSIDLISTTPGLIIEGAEIHDPLAGPDVRLFSAAQVRASVELVPLLAGNARIDELVMIDSQINWSVDEQGQNNWQPVIEALTASSSSEQEKEATSPSSEPPGEDGTSSGGGLPAISTMTLQNIAVVVSDKPRNLEAELVLNVSGSTSYPAGPTTLTLDGNVNQTPVDVVAELGTLAGLSSENASIGVDLNATADDTVLTLDGVVAPPSQPEDWDIAWALDAPGLDDLAQASALEMPAVPAFAVAARLTRDGPEYVIGDLDIQIQDSDLRGDVRVNPDTQPLTVFANLTSHRIVVDELTSVMTSSGADEKSNDNTDGAAQTEEGDDRSASGDTLGDDERVLPADPIDVAGVRELIQGAIEYRVNRLDSDSIPVDALDIRAEIDASAAQVTLNSLGFAGGNVEGTLSVDWQASPMEAVLETRLQQIDLRRLMQAVDIQDASYTVLGGRGKFWVRGDSAAAMAASLDGGLFLLMTRGKLDALITELAGIDLYESFLEWVDPDSTRTELRCAYVDLQIADVRVDVAEFVIDTEDTVFRAYSSLDLNHEQLDLVIEPRPMDVSLLALPTSINIGGTLAQPAVTPGAELAGRVAASVALAAVASPVAALLPLVQADTANDSVFCDGFVRGMNEVR